MSGSMGRFHPSMKAAKTSRENCLCRGTGGSKWLQGKTTAGISMAFTLPVHDNKHPRQQHVGLHWRHLADRHDDGGCREEGWVPVLFLFYSPWSLKTLWPKETKESTCIVGNAKVMERGQPRCWGQPPPLSTALRASIGRFYPKQAARKIGFFYSMSLLGVGDGEVLVLGCSLCVSCLQSNSGLGWSLSLESKPSSDLLLAHFFLLWISLALANYSTNPSLSFLSRTAVWEPLRFLW